MTDSPKRKRMVKKASSRINEGHKKSFLENFMDHPPSNEKNLNDFLGRNREMSDEKKHERNQKKLENTGWKV